MEIIEVSEVEFWSTVEAYRSKSTIDLEYVGGMSPEEYAHYMGMAEAYEESTGEVPVDFPF